MPGRRPQLSGTLQREPGSRSQLHPPEFGQATLDLATALEGLGRGAEAVTVYDSYLQRWPNASDKDDVAERKQRASATEG